MPPSCNAAATTLIISTATTVKATSDGVFSHACSCFFLFLSGRWLYTMFFFSFRLGWEMLRQLPAHGSEFNKATHDALLESVKSFQAHVEARGLDLPKSTTLHFDSELVRDWSNCTIAIQVRLCALEVPVLCFLSQAPEAASFQPPFTPSL